MRDDFDSHEAPTSDPSAQQPIDPVARYRHAEALVSQGAPMHALSELEPLLRAEPDSVSVLELAARAYFKTAQLSRAEKTFARIVALDPTDSYARFALGRSLERQSRHGEAVGHYRVACALEPREEYLEALQRAEQRQEQG